MFVLHNMWSYGHVHHESKVQCRQREVSVLQYSCLAASGVISCCKIAAMLTQVMYTQLDPTCTDDISGNNAADCN